MEEMQQEVSAPNQPTASKGDDKTLYVPQKERQLVARWRRKVEARHKKMQPLFKRMRENMQLAKEGADETWIAGNNYVVPLIVRHINQAVSTLYAKNPTAVAKRRKTLDYVLWDGTPESLQEAMMAVQPPMADPAGGDAPISPATGLPWQPDPMAQALLKEIATVREQHLMLDRFGKAMEILWRHFTSDKSSTFKSLMKALVRRVKVCGVGYVELAYQRQTEVRPEVEARLKELTNQLAEVERLQECATEHDYDPEGPDAAQLEYSIQQLQTQLERIVSEGPLFDFPHADEIIFDDKTRHLKTWYGASWTARAFDMTPAEVKKIYKVDITGNFVDFRRNPDDPSLREMEDKIDEDGRKVTAVARLYRIQDREAGQEFTICIGYPGFIKPPQEPDVKLDRFFSTYALTFNEVENKNEPIPPSDVWLLRHPQQDTNRARQGLREHRVANRPAYAVPKGALDKTDKDKLQTRPPHALLELKGLKQGGSVDQLVQPIKPVPIDPNLYDTSQNFQDVLRAVGTQEANLGPTAGNTATETSVAENSRVASINDNIDDLDEFLGDLARGTGDLMLLEMSPEMVQEICGPGAVWPAVQGNRAEIAKNLWLEIKAGSAGRPNAALQLANIERAWPMLQLLPGVNPRPLVEKAANLLEIDVEDLYVEGLPSIQALNTLAGTPAVQPGTGDPATEPTAQGGQGAQNQAQPPGAPPGPQPAMPAPSDGMTPTPMA